MSVAANQVTPRADDCRGSLPVAASTTIYEQTLVFANASGYADDDTASGVNTFAGVAIDEYDNSAGSNGDVASEFWTEGKFKLTGANFTQASVGKDAYASDNYTVTQTPTASTVRIGTIVGYVSSTVVWVAIDSQHRNAKTDAAAVKTADYTVLASESGKLFSTVGAAGAVTFAMPAATPGLKYRFHVGAAQELRIDPNGTETISLPSTGVAGAAGKYLTANAAGETVDIECPVAGTWAVFGFTGTWTAEA